MLSITPLPAFNDNYLWLITQPNSQEAYIVDPGDSQVVYEALKSRGLSLKGVLITHWHRDHTGGINDLLAKAATLTPSGNSDSIPVYGPISDKIPQVTHPLQHNDTVSLYGQYPFKVIETHGHTLEHIVYYLAPQNHLSKQTPPLLFCGDALFAGGCGRFAGGPNSIFQGSAEQMHHSLSQLAQLPDDTLVYCAHEYTLANLSFAQLVEPSNSTINERIIKEQKKRALDQPTIPSSIGLEKQTNPFMRVNQNSVKTTIENHWNTRYQRDSDTLKGLRRWKDQL